MEENGNRLQKKLLNYIIFPAKAMLFVGLARHGVNFQAAPHSLYCHVLRTHSCLTFFFQDYASPAT